MELKFKIANDHIKADGIKTAPVSDSINHLTAVFEFDDAWDKTVKTAVFGNGSNTYHVILNDDMCVIPWEALTGAKLVVSVFGIKDDMRITATELNIPLARSGYKDGQEPDKPTDSAYTQLLQMLSWVVTNKAQLSKFADGSADVPDMINVAVQDGTITLTQALAKKADQSALDTEISDRQAADEALAESINANYYTKTETEQLVRDSTDSIGAVSGRMYELENKLTLKENVCDVNLVTETDVTAELADNVRTICKNEVTSLTITLPELFGIMYISSVIFTSGATATNFIYPDTIKMIGDSCIDGEFTPAANKRYEIIVSYDGANAVGVVGGYAI